MRRYLVWAKHQPHRCATETKAHLPRPPSPALRAPSPPLGAGERGISANLTARPSGITPSAAGNCPARGRREKRWCGELAADRPAGTTENSPALQLGGRTRERQVPEGRQTPCLRVSFVPPGLTSVATFNPALKCWAIFLLPSERTLYRGRLQGTERCDRCLAHTRYRRIQSPYEVSVRRAIWLNRSTSRHCSRNRTFGLGMQWGRGRAGPGFKGAFTPGQLPACQSCPHKPESCPDAPR